MKALNGVNRVSVTTDMWKSDQKISYMVVTCHFVDSNYHLQKKVLNFCDIPPPHSGVCISDALHKCLVEWGIENKIWTITVDNSSYNDVAIRTLKGSLSYKNTLPFGGMIFYVRCCAHILNLLVQDGISEIEDVITKVRESVKYITASESRINLFTEIAKQLQLSSKKLVLDCSMRDCELLRLSEMNLWLESGVYLLGDEQEKQEHEDLTKRLMWGIENVGWAYRGAEGKSGGILSMWNHEIFAASSNWDMEGAVARVSVWRGTSIRFGGRLRELEKEQSQAEET
ncbi:hypothetical protein ACS0TY_013983 [Phlomoides rotata]